MDLLFRGMLFVLLDFNLDLGEHTIGLIPDWLGYWWVAKGFLELAEEWDGFRKGRSVALALAVYTGVLYGMDLLALSVQIEALVWVLYIIATAAGLVTTWIIAKGVCRMEENHGWDLQGRKLNDLWLYMAVLDIVAVLFSWVPVVGVVGIVASMIIAICYLVALNGCRKRYWEYGDR